MTTPRKSKPSSSAAVSAEQLRADITAEAVAELARIAEAERENKAVLDQKDAEFDVLLDQWQSECALARSEYRAEPPRPQRPDTRLEAALAGRLVQQRLDAHDRASKMVGWKKAEIETAWAAVMPDLVARAEEAMKPLRVLVEEVNGWRQLLAEARRADENARGSRQLDGPSTRMRSSINVVDVVNLAAGVDVCAPAPLPPRDESYEQAAEDAERQESRRMTREIATRERLEAQGIRRYL